MPVIERQKITCVRCPALGGVMVTEAACKGLVDAAGEQWKRCPYYLREEADTIKCGYHPDNPKKAFQNAPGETRRGVTIEGPNAIRPNQIFSVHVHGGTAQGTQYESALVNIT